LRAKNSPARGYFAASDQLGDARMFRSLFRAATGAARAALPMGPRPATRALPFSSSAAGLDTAMRATAPKRRKTAGVISIRNTWNNTLVTISDMDYKVKGWMSAGQAGFKKSKRSSFFAMEKCLSEAFLKARTVRKHAAARCPLVAPPSAR